MRVFENKVMWRLARKYVICILHQIVFRVIKWSSFRWNAEWERPLEITGHRWQDNIKMVVKELTQDKTCDEFFLTLINFLVLYTRVNPLSASMELVNPPRSVIFQDGVSRNSYEVGMILWYKEERCALRYCLLPLSTSLFSHPPGHWIAGELTTPARHLLHTGMFKRQRFNEVSD